MFKLLQRIAFGFLLFAMIIRSHRIIRKGKFIPRKGDVERCKENPLNCNDIKHYPIEHIKSLAANNKLFRETFNVEKMRKPEDIIENNDAFDKGISNGYKTFCKTKETVIYPQIGKTDGYEAIDQLFVIQINDESGYQQGVVVDMCLPSDSGHQCNVMRHHLDGNTTCVQKHGRKFLWAVDPFTGDPKIKPFEFPTDCICMFQQT